jgi:predicted nucleic acid-binding Zn ribbon protein
MPTYTFRDKNTGETFDKIMKIAELDSFRDQNPHLESVIHAPAFTGDHVTASRKYDTGFKEVLQRIHEKTPGSQLDKSSSQL